MIKNLTKDNLHFEKVNKDIETNEKDVFKVVNDLEII